MATSVVTGDPRSGELEILRTAIDIGTSEKLALNTIGGDDSFSATGNLAVLIGITVDGGTVMHIPTNI